MATPTISDKFKAALTNSVEATLRRSLVMLHGGSGVGKTCAAMTISEQLPELPAPAPVEITDTVLLGIDRGAADSLAGVGVKVKHYIDFNVLVELCDGNPVTALNEAAKIVAVLIQTEGVKNLVVDAFSTYVGKVVIYYDGKPAEFKSINGSFDGNAFYRRVLTVGKAAYDMLLKLPCNVVFLSHTKVDAAVTAQGAAKDRAEWEAKAGGLAMAGKLEIDVVGQSAKLLTNESSIIMPLEAKVSPEGKVTRKFIIEDYSQTYQVKNRFAPFLSKTEEPNLNKVFKKIRLGIDSKFATK